jgi:hypothetical protein
MNERKRMTVDEFDLMVRAMYREWKQQPKCITVQGDSTFYKSSDTHIFVSSSNYVWPTIKGHNFEVLMPTGFFKSKEKRKFNEALKLVREMRSGEPITSVEDIICEHITYAKDIIAERALVDDHK